MDRKIAVVCLSGGIDSATTLGIAISRGYTTHTISFGYGQKHQQELRQARRISSELGAKSHKEVELDTSIFSGSSLTGTGKVPVGRVIEEISTGVPSTFVPGRNLVFLSLATAYVVSLGGGTVFIGANQVDFSGYPDCRMDFIQSFEDSASLAIRGTGIAIEAPLIYMKKSDVVSIGSRMGIDYGLTVSCYQPVGLKHCGTCDSCVIRKQAFIDSGLTDPTSYKEC